MNEDRELLELAAKAAGVHAVEWAEAGQLLSDKGGFVQFIGHGKAAVWSPLTDDGDALRLAVKIKQLISINDENTFAAAQIENMSRLDRNGLQHIEHGKDPYAATRRAIVRAAAEIGKAMP